jgi:capsular exopolysaccharide synthesis family protein
MLPPPPALAASPDAFAILKGLRRRWWAAMLLVLVLGPAAAVGAWFLLEAKYTAVAPVHIASQPPWILNHRDGYSDRGEFATFQKLQAAEMKSRFVLDKVRLRDEVKKLDILRDQADPIAFLDEELKIDFKDGDEIVNIQMLGMDPEAVKTVVNAVREEYFTEVVDRDRKARGERKKVLEEAVNGQRTQFQQHLRQLNEMANSLGMTANGQPLPKGAGPVSVAGEKMRHLAEAQRDRLKAQSLLKVHEARGKNLATMTISEAELDQAVEQDQEVRFLQVRLDRQKEIIKGYEEGSPNDPSLPGLRQRRESLKAKLEARRDEVRKAFADGTRRKAKADYDAALEQYKTDLVAATEQEEALKAEIKKLPVDEEKTVKSSADFERLRLDVEAEQGRLNNYENQLADLNVELGPDVPARITKYQDAMILKRDLRKQIVAACGAPLMILVLACLGVGWWECRARRIHSADEVSAGLGMRVVGAVPSLANAGRLVAADEETADVRVHGLLESIDGIRTLLLREADVDPLRVILVTSAVSGEGKTTLASHLAGSLARAGRRTLLIDCDLRRPAAHQLFELPLQPGFSEALMGEVHVAEATLSTAIDSLWMIPAGDWDREVMQALARDGVGRIFDKLRNEYDFIIVDSHPVLPATDSLLIAQHADAVVLSVLREVSRTPRVYAAFQKLATLGIHVLGAVVSGLPAEDVYSGGYQYAAPVPR